jgi:FMN phosphatase YigB (HAD superfamily)
VFSARVHLNKPEPAIFELAAARFDSAPCELVLLGEHGPNVQAACALGWNTLPFSAAAQAEAEMAERGWW